jgi:hypothetical protein
MFKRVVKHYQIPVTTDFLEGTLQDAQAIRVMPVSLNVRINSKQILKAGLLQQL